MTSGNKRVKTYCRNGNIILKITEDNKNNIKQDIVIGKNILMTLLGTLDKNKQNISTIASYHSDYDIFMSYDKDVIKSIAIYNNNFELIEYFEYLNNYLKPLSDESLKSYKKDTKALHDAMSKIIIDTDKDIKDALPPKTNEK